MCLESKRILVVEDEALLAMMIEDVILDGGAEVVGIAATVDHALSLIEALATAGGIDAAVLDVNLAGQMSAAVADALAERRIPFVFATGYGDAHDRGRHRSAPILGKPFGSEALLAAVCAVMAPFDASRHGCGRPACMGACP